MTVKSRLQSTLLTFTYKMYLRFFGRGSDLFQVSERIVEYPFAVESVLRLPKGSTVAVFGCHADMLTTLLPTLGYETHGVDVKDFRLQREGFTFHKADARKTTFADARFDAVFAVSTLEHIGLFDNDETGDLKAAREMARVLKPGGLFILTVPFASSSKVIPAFERIYDEASLRTLLQGLDVESISLYATEPGALWHPIELHQAPVPQGRTSCTALVTARRPTGEPRT
jgi:SAM-dependent methyltransferase